MDGVSIRPEVQESGDRGLKLLGTKRANLVQNEAQSGKKVCVAHSIQYKTGEIRGVREMADMRESQGGALGEERDDFTLQSSVRGEEAKMVEYLADGDLLVLLCGNCRGHCPFAFIPFIT